MKIALMAFLSVALLGHMGRVWTGKRGSPVTDPEAVRAYAIADCTFLTFLLIWMWSR